LPGESRQQDTNQKDKYNFPTSLEKISMNPKGRLSKATACWKYIGASDFILNTI